MMGTADIPHRDSLRAYGHAVAGHAGTMTSPDGELFIKPCTQAELDFYHTANSLPQYEDFAELMPVFMGELRLSDPSSIDMSDVAGAAGAAGQAAMEQVKATLAAAEVANEEAQAAEAAQAKQTPQSAPSWAPKSKSKKIKTDLAIVLENTASKFKHPNILDVKLGRRLWADDAQPEKKERFDKISEVTTHKNFGFRIAGMRVYRGSENPSDLGPDEYRTYDKDYGRTQVNDDNIHEAIGKFIFNEAAGIDKELGNAVLAAFVHEVEKVRDVLMRHESRMYSASLLFVFEGDGASLREAIEENNEVVERPVARNTTNKRVDSGIAMEDEDDEDEDEEVSLPSVYSVKLIDFAHATWTKGQGPDENVLLGVNSLVDIFKKLSE